MRRGDWIALAALVIAVPGAYLAMVELGIFEPPAPPPAPLPADPDPVIDTETPAGFNNAAAELHEATDDLAGAADSLAPEDEVKLNFYRSLSNAFASIEAYDSDSTPYSPNYASASRPPPTVSAPYHGATNGSAGDSWYSPDQHANALTPRPAQRGSEWDWANAAYTDFAYFSYNDTYVVCPTGHVVVEERGKLFCQRENKRLEPDQTRTMSKRDFAAAWKPGRNSDGDCPKNAQFGYLNKKPACALIPT